jgi:hypothetical protein
LKFSFRLLLAIVLMALPCLGQSSSPDDSSIQDDVYTNFFFQFRYPFTASWVQQGPPAVKQIQSAHQISLGAEAAASSNFHYLLTLVRNMPGQGPGHGRAVMVLMAEDVSSDASIVSGKEFTEKFAERVKKEKYIAVGQPREAEFGGRTFFRQDFKGTSALGTPIYESAFFMLARGHALGFVLASPTEAMLNNMVTLIERVKFY